MAFWPWPEPRTSSARCPVGVYSRRDLTCRALVHWRHPVHAMAFHPRLPLLAIGTGRYDGGHHFGGELLLLSLDTGVAVPLVEHLSGDDASGRQVLGLEWLDDQALRVLMAPPDDWQDAAACTEGHVAVVRRTDWSRVPPGSVTSDDLAGPRIPVARPDGREAARALVTRLSAGWKPRRNVRAVEPLPDGRILATLDGVLLEAWSPSGEREWSVADEEGGREIVVTGETVWVSSMRPDGEIIRLSLADGALLDRVTPSGPVSLVRCSDGRPALAPRALDAFPIRSASRLYFLTFTPMKGDELARGEASVDAVALSTLPADRPGEPDPAEIRTLFPHAWEAGERHIAGPGAETPDGTLVHAGRIYDGRGLQPGGSFVVRRSAATGTPLWVFRTDRPATTLALDEDAVYVAYDDGEIIVLDLHDGTARRRGHMKVGAVPVRPTALTVAGPGRLLIGTSDGRVVDFADGLEVLTE
ncbi:outer membrane protein assembly factor BamB family protein [Herbidospora sp. RD11066]